MSRLQRSAGVKEAWLCPSAGVRPPWAAWSACSVTCGGGYRTRTRGPIRVHGTAQQFSACSLQPCGTATSPYLMLNIRPLTPPPNP
ncbi:SCO-spondin [Liparis tanakae]|uniref:SCO-spondin n=1 Tax=Liparis tanakae TaxID=230148 RepID=A0A4Z2E1S6_9TELE|nr:SCO-spondin [Liparis tanakae]